MSGELSSKLADAYREGFTAAAEHVADAHHLKADEHRVAMMETMERELSEIIRQMGVIDFDDPNLPEPIRKMFGPIANPTHQVDLFFAIGAAFGLIFTGSAAAAAGLLNSLTNKSMRLYGNVYPDASTIAAAMVRGHIPEGEGNDWFDNIGVKNTRSQAHVDLAWNHLPAGTALDLFRRRKISQDQLQQILRWNGVPVDEALALIESAVGPLDYGTAVSAVTQNQINMGEFADLLPQYGIEPKWAEIIFESAGATMPPEMAVRLFREHRIDLATFEQVLLESNLKNKYVPMMKWLQFRPPPMEQTLRMRRYGLIEHAEAVDILEQNGFETKYAELLTTAAETQAEGGGKDLTTATMIDLYEVGKWDRGTLVAELVKAGYDPTESDLLATLADERRVIAQQNRAASKIRSRYVMWKIDRSEALNALNQVGIPPDQVAEALDVWDVERDAQTLHLTRVDIKKAVQANVISEADGRARLLGMGYDPADVNVIVQIDKW